MTACTHSTVIEDARNSQPKRINDTSPILLHQTIITMKLHNHHVLEREDWSGQTSIPLGDTNLYITCVFHVHIIYTNSTLQLCVCATI